MSHFSRIQTCLRDEVLLKETLAKLDCNVEVGKDLEVVNDKGEKQAVHMLADVGAGNDKVGFMRMNDGTFEICADWFRIERNCQVIRHKFVQAVTQTYARLGIVKQAEAQGYIIEKEEVLENGEIHLVVSEPV